VSTESHNLHHMVFILLPGAPFYHYWSYWFSWGTAGLGCLITWSHWLYH